MALALVPEAVAFAFVAGGEPPVGLYAVFMVDLVAEHGVEYLFATVVLMGVLQFGAEALRLGKFVRHIPHPVMLGFVNGLAIVIFLAPFGQVKAARQGGVLVWMEGPALYLMLGLVAMAMAVIVFLPTLIMAFLSALAALVGVMFMVVVGTFAWSSLGILYKSPRRDNLVLVLVSAVTVFTDLAIAKTYRLHGSLFYGSVRSFHDQFDSAGDPDEVVIDYRGSRVWDHSGLESVSSLTERYLGRGSSCVSSTSAPSAAPSSPTPAA